MIVDRILDIVSRRLAHFLSAPIRGYRPIVTFDPQCLAKVLRPADILLIEGESRRPDSLRAQDVELVRVALSLVVRDYVKLGASKRGVRP